MNFIKHGLAQVLLYGCGLIIVSGSSFLLLPFYTRQFPPGEFALITLVLTFLPLTRYCLPLELSQAVPIFSADDQSKKINYISVGWWFIVLMNILCYTFIYLANAVFHFIALSSINFISILALLAIDCLFYFTSNILRWDLRHYTYNAIISGVAILEICLTVTFILFFKLTIFGVFYSWTISRLLGFLLNYSLTHRYYRFIFDTGLLKKMLRFSIPLVISNIPYNLNRSVDRWLIATFIGLSSVGIYGAGSTMGGVIGFIMGSLSSALTPMIYRGHERKEAPRDIIRLFYLVMTVCMFAALFFALYNREILHWLVAKSYYDVLANQPIVPMVVLSAIFSGLYMFSPGLFIKKKTLHVIWFNVVSLSINLLLSLLLIFKFGIIGIAFATFISVLVNAILYMVFSQRYYPLPFQYSHLIPLIVLFIMTYTGGIWLGLNCIPFAPNSMVMRAVYFAALCLLSSGFVWKICKDLSFETDFEAVPPLLVTEG